MDGSTAVMPQAERQQDRRNPLFFPVPKSSKLFGKSGSQTPAQVASWDNLSSSIASTFILSPPRSPTTTISKGGKRKSQRVVSPQVVASILDGMYAYPVNRESNRLSPPKYQDKASLHHKSSLGTVASRISAMPRRSSESFLHQPSRTSYGARGHNFRKDFPPINDELEPSNTRRMEKTSDTQSGNSQDSGSAVRIVGRGGSGSRPRVVAPTPEAQTLDPPHWEQPAPPSRSVHPGAGGSRSCQKPVSPTPALFSLLRRRKQQGPSSKGKERESTYLHPVSPALSYQITNESRSTVSTIQFAGQTGAPTPSFFPLDDSLKPASPEKISLTLSSSTSVDFTVEDASSETRTPSTEDFDSDSYVEDPPPEERRKKSMNKLARTLGDLPDNDLHDISPRPMPGKKEFMPKPFIDDELTIKDPKKAFRRASLSLSSMSSVFGRPSGKRRRDSIKSHHSLSTLTDDLHQLNLVDDFSDTSSACNAPGSPILFSPPSPSTVRPPNPATPSPYGVEVEQEFLSVSSPSLSRSHSYSHTPRPRNERLSNHSYSASTSLLAHDATISGSSTWIFPPSDDCEEVTFTAASDATEELQTWTGEWNGDIDDVIRALRALR